MSSSSTSSSERTLDLTGFRPTALIVCLAALAVFEIFARSVDVWSVVPRSNSGIMDQMETRVIEPSRSPRVLVLGSSRIRDAVLPETLEYELGLERGDVLNLGTTAGTPFDALTLVRRHPKLIENVELAIVGVEDWYVDGTYPHNERDMRYASMSERLAYPTRVQLLTGLLWHTYGANTAIRRWLRRLGRPGPDVELLPDGRFSWRTGDTSDEDPPDRADQLFATYEPATHRLDQLAQLVQILEQAGAAVAIVQVPLHPAYSARMAEKYPQVRRDLMRLLESRRGHAEVRLWGAEPGVLTVEDFYDYGHLYDAGARTFSTRLARDLRSR